MFVTRRFGCSRYKRLRVKLYQVMRGIPPSDAVRLSGVNIEYIARAKAVIWYALLHIEVPRVFLDGVGPFLWAEANITC